MSASIHRRPAKAFQAACAEQRKIDDLVERLKAKLFALAEQAHAEPRNWGIHGDLVHIREQLEGLLGDRG